MEQSNQNIALLIKLRHLSKSLQTNWEQLNMSKLKTTEMLQEANSIMQLFGTEKGKSAFQKDFETMNNLKQSINQKLETFKELIIGKNAANSEILYQEFLEETDELSDLFVKIGKYKDEYFNKTSSSDWYAIWAIIQSNLYTIKGIGESAYIQLQMFEEFNQQEVDELSLEIIKYIPTSYNIEDAIKYKDEYLVALQQIEKESNQKTNLWDRFLNLVAGNVPFEQSPQERVMMMRWLEGERGELNN